GRSGGTGGGVGRGGCLCVRVIRVVGVGGGVGCLLCRGVRIRGRVRRVRIGVRIRVVLCIGIGCCGCVRIGRCLCRRLSRGIGRGGRFRSGSGVGVRRRRCLGVRVIGVVGFCGGLRGCRGRSVLIGRRIG